MSRTIFLAAIAIAAMLMAIFPGQVALIKWVAILLAVAFLIVRALQTYPRQYRERRRKAALQAADAEAYKEYELELEAIRNRHDPHRVGAEGHLPSAYQDELTALSERHRDMLTRKFGAY